MVQTFQNFEVIVVNNGSTDNSPAILESYVPKFGGRLKILHMEINSGSPSLALNKATLLARGKYAYIIDSDDLILNYTLETFYNFAEKFGAELVHADRRLEFISDSETKFPNKVQLANTHGGKIVNEPTFETEDPVEKLKVYLNYGFASPAWSNFVRRDVLVKNNITFRNLPWASDTMWTFKVVFLAKKILHIPQPLYIWRRNPYSVSHHKRTPSEAITFHMNTVAGGIDELCNFMNQQPFFRDNPNYYFAVLEYFWNGHASLAWKYAAQMPPYEYYKTIETNLSKNFEDKYLISYLITQANLFHLRTQVAYQKIQDLENKLKQIQGG